MPTVLGSGSGELPAAGVEVAPTVRIAAGSGQIDEPVLTRVRGEVDQALVRLAPTFRRATAALRPFTVFVHEDRDRMPAALVPHLHADSPGFAMLGQHQIHVVLGELQRTGARLRGVVVHELVHELLDQEVSPHGRSMPRWFHEGLAQLLAGDTYLGASEEDLLWRVGARRLSTFGELRDSFPSEPGALRTAYGQSHSYVAWLAQQYGLDELLWVARAADPVTSFERALVGRLGRSTLELEDGWRHHLVHGSGAGWRLLLDQCFNLSLLALLPVLVLALMRRLSAEQRARRRLLDAPPPNGAESAASAMVAGAPGWSTLPEDPQSSPHQGEVRPGAVAATDDDFDERDAAATDAAEPSADDGQPWRAPFHRPDP